MHETRSAHILSLILVGILTLITCSNIRVWVEMPTPEQSQLTPLAGTGEGVTSSSPVLITVTPLSSILTSTPAPVATNTPLPPTLTPTLIISEDAVLPAAPTVSPTPALILEPATQPAETGEATLIQTVQSFPAPGRLTEGITWDGQYLWLSDNSATIFQVDTSGKTLNALAPPDVTPEDLTWDGSSFWIYTTNYNNIYQFQFEGRETKTLSIFKSPDWIIGSSGMTWDGENLWYADRFNVYRLDTSGNILSSFAFPKEVTGLAWDGSYLWLAYNDDPFANSILSVVDTEGNVLSSFPSPVQIEGLTWGDEYLWAVSGSTIYQLDVSLARDTLTSSSDAAE